MLETSVAKFTITLLMLLLPKNVLLLLLCCAFLIFFLFSIYRSSLSGAEITLVDRECIFDLLLRKRSNNSQMLKTLVELFILDTSDISHRLYILECVLQELRPAK